MPGTELISFQRNIVRINRTRMRMESLFDNGALKKIDIETVYEALFLRAVTNFESFLEQLFISVLLGRSNHPPARAKRLMIVNRRSDLMTVLVQRGNYLDWLPYDKTAARAKIYLKDGRPFTELTDGDRAHIKRVALTRNAIAHRSDHSAQQFQANVIQSMILLPREKTPAGFLRSQVTANPRQIRFEIYISELVRIAAALA